MHASEERFQTAANSRMNVSVYNWRLKLANVTGVTNRISSPLFRPYGTAPILAWLPEVYHLTVSEQGPDTICGSTLDKRDYR